MYYHDEHICANNNYDILLHIACQNSSSQLLLIVYFCICIISRG